MNKRIQELLYKANGQYHGISALTGKEIINTEFVDYEKFAELIVRECIEQGDTLAKHYIDKHPEQEQAMLLASIADYSNEIKQHFGVEE